MLGVSCGGTGRQEITEGTGNDERLEGSQRRPEVGTTSGGAGRHWGGRCILGGQHGDDEPRLSGHHH